MMEVLRRWPIAAATLAVLVLAALMLGARLLLSGDPGEDMTVAGAVDPGGSPVTATTAMPAAPLPSSAAAGFPERAAQQVDWRQSATRLESAAATLSAAIRAARAGDAAAQYHVARTIGFCRGLEDAGDAGSEAARRACGEILAHPGLADLGAGRPAEAWVTMLGEAVRAGEPRALGYAALHCINGSPCDPMGGSDRNMSLASAQSRAGRAIASGDPEAIFSAGRAIASDSVGRSPVRGAAWMLVACRKGFDCSASNELNEALRCTAGRAGCAPGGNVEDRLQTALGPGGFAEAYALSQEFSQLLEAGDPPVRSWAFGR